MPPGPAIHLDRNITFVGAVLDAIEGGGPLDAAVQALRRAEAAAGLWIMDDQDADLGDGTFLPRGDRPLLPARLREIGRSWEQFDRAFAQEPEADARVRIGRHLWAFLDETGLLLGGVDFARDHLVVFDDGAVGCWSPSGWAKVMAEWARSRSLGGRDAWHPDDFAGPLDPIVPGYPAWRDAVRSVIARARSA
jgi:hypothetical protein